jgi:hypothetical protein
MHVRSVPEDYNHFLPNPFLFTAHNYLHTPFDTLQLIHTLYIYHTQICNFLTWKLINYYDKKKIQIQLLYFSVKRSHFSSSPNILLLETKNENLGKFMHGHWARRE